MRLSHISIPVIVGNSVRELLGQINLVFTQIRDLLSRLVDSNNELDSKLFCVRSYVRDKDIKSISFKVDNQSVDVNSLDKLYIIFQLDEVNNRLKVFVKYSNGVVKSGFITLS